MNLTVTVNSLSLSSDTITWPLTFCSLSLLFFSRRFSMTLWKVDSSLKRTSGVRLRANRRNIVGQQIPTMLDVTRCVCVHTLLHVVGCCRAKFDTGQTFSPVQTDATLLANNSQHCSGELLLRFHVRSFKDSLLQSFLSLLVAIIHHLHIYNTPCLPPKPFHNLCF